ncbi:MAG: hypothetical protein IT372_39775 [Polyangiaceae bacterium]|nr:hypothetical protein [Polyangiaceae bacterium]
MVWSRSSALAAALLLAAGCRSPEKRDASRGDLSTCIDLGGDHRRSCQIQCPNDSESCSGQCVDAYQLCIRACSGVKLDPVPAPTGAPAPPASAVPPGSAAPPASAPQTGNAR